MCITSTLVSMYDSSWHIYLLFDSIRHFILELQIVCAVAIHFLLTLNSSVICKIFEGICIYNDMHARMTCL